ncbi:MAG: type 4a pilus biogenesis protein PilO [Desulfofustis sp.]|nr:type 4a pilus biogenesis protein PilO [Desulfofustis sp.]
MAKKNILSGLRVKSGFDRLARRERFFVSAGVLFVVCFLLFVGVVSPYLEAKKTLERSLLRKEQEVLDMAILQQEYRELKSRQSGVVEQLKSRSPQFSLFSYLEKQASEVKVKDRVTYMKPSSSDLDDGYMESAVEMKMEEVTLGQLVDFLTQVESVENVVVIKRIAIQKNKRTEDLLDAVISIFTIEKKAA